MESPDNYNFSIFSPRNVHGRKNRNVILTMLLIWAVAVFGFHFLLRGIEKPVPEKTLDLFETNWQAVQAGDLQNADAKAFLKSLVLVNGKGTVADNDKEVLSAAISCISDQIIPDSIGSVLGDGVTELGGIKSRLVLSSGQEYEDLKAQLAQKRKEMTELTAPYTGLEYGSLEAVIYLGSLNNDHPASFNDEMFAPLPDIMNLYLVHFQSFLTDARFLGFPFHYFYTAVLLLVLFVGLCIVYNIMVEWRLNKEGVSE